jgi:hypothetical protein
MAHRNLVFIILICVSLCSGSCGEMKDSMSGISPEPLLNNFFETWKKRDWKTMYTLVHPNLIQQVRMGKLSPDERRMGDEELFIRQFERASKINPDRTLKSYQVISISTYKAGDTTVWAEAVVNGRKKRIPLTLVGLTLKVDLTRIE